MNSTEEQIKKYVMGKFAEVALEVWIEVAKEYGVDYKIDPKTKRAFLKDPLNAMARNYGSGTLGIPAEFWYDKAITEWKKRVWARIKEDQSR